MMRDVCAHYMKQVGRKLYCSKSEKARLLDGLRAELADTCPKSGKLSLAGIVAQFGSPKDMAAELQAVLPPEERERYFTRRRWQIRLGAAALILVIVFQAGFLIWLTNIDVHCINEEIVVDAQYLINEED